LRAGKPEWAEQVVNGRLFFVFEGEITIQKDTVLLNERIRAREVRTIDDEGQQLGVLPVREALRIAQEKGLDLVMVAADASPPVCKIMDYGRHKFEQEKRTREARKKQHTVSLKEVTLSYKIGEHDYQVRLRAVRKFIQEADKVKITIRFRGREMQHQALGTNVLMRFAKDCVDIAIIERDPRAEGRTLFIILAPKKGLVPAREQKPPQAEKSPGAVGAVPSEPAQ
jgi:translation initiation factor IF-3